MRQPALDAHQHFWKYNPASAWITDDMAVLKQDFLPADLQPLLRAHAVTGCIAVQADETDEETEFLVNLAANNDFIRGVVGWVDLESERLEEKLRYYRQSGIIKGFRPMLQNDPQRDRMLQPAFLNGIRLLQQYGYTCDLIILPDQLAFAAELAAAHPEMRFVIDHLAKPALKSGHVREWKQNIKRFRTLENVYCKLSGLVTEADWINWEKQDFNPVINQVVETFGISRIMFGSDWPVCLLAAGYGKVREIMDSYFASFPIEQQQQFFAGNAMTFYSISG